MPIIPSLELQAIKQLADIPQWVCWRGTGDKQTAKRPYNPVPAAPASVIDSSTWGDFAAATHAISTNPDFASGGVGFVLTDSGDDADMIAIDLDDCVKNDKPTKEALKIVKLINSYTEFSPSRKGLHIYALGSIERDGRRHGNIEIYAARRYVTVT